MAALDTPWLDFMSSPPQSASGGSVDVPADPNPPTVAAFSPSSSGLSPPYTKQRATILVHQKSPLLAATPPQITRALAYSHPFILPLNKLAGLISWTTGDPWESFLLVAAFWFVTLYGDTVIRWAGPLVLVILLILGMYSRRYSPLSSTGWTGEKVRTGRKRGDSDLETHHHKSLDEIVQTLKDFTARCNILMDPFLRLTEFLSTQRTATSATTRPALTALFIRILLVTPVWILLTLPPLRIITTKRCILAFGTLVLSWHSRPARISRTILWRSRLVRRICTTITGLDLTGIGGKVKPPPLPPRKSKSPQDVAASLAAKRRPESPGIRFTFSLYENQRRWLGIGWTTSMLAYERGAWTDEHLNTMPPRDKFELPDVEGGHARWRWVEGSEWRIDGADAVKNEGPKKDADNDAGWIYYDNKWRDGRRGQDGWGRYTRRRKWYRDAELVEVTPSTEITPSPTPKPPEAGAEDTRSEAGTVQTEATATLTDTADAADSSSSNKARRKSWFRRSSQPASERSGTINSSGSYGSDVRSDEDDVHRPLTHEARESEWALGDELKMQLG